MGHLSILTSDGQTLLIDNYTFNDKYLGKINNIGAGGNASKMEFNGEIYSLLIREF